jgi:hypothetical protein
MPDREFGFHSLTRAVRQGTIPWSVKGFFKAREVVRRAKAGKIRVPPSVVGFPADLLEESEVHELALGLWLRHEHGDDAPEVPAAHHLRFHTIEHFLERHGDLLLEEGLVQLENEVLEPSPLLLAELVARPYDTALTSRETPDFDAVEVLKAVARRAREGMG